MPNLCSAPVSPILADGFADFLCDAPATVLEIHVSATGQIWPDQYRCSAHSVQEPARPAFAQV